MFLVKLCHSWRGNIDGDMFILKFTKEMKMTEKMGGSYNTVEFKLRNGNELTFMDATILENTIGSAPIVVNFRNNDKQIEIYKKTNPDNKYYLDLW